MTLTLTTSDRERQQWSKSEVNKLLYNGKLIIFLKILRTGSVARNFCYSNGSLLFRIFSAKSVGEEEITRDFSLVSFTYDVNVGVTWVEQEPAPPPNSSPNNVEPRTHRKILTYCQVSRFKIKPGGREYDFLPNFVNFLKFIVQVCSLHQIRYWRSAIKGQA